MDNWGFLEKSLEVEGGKTVFLGPMRHHPILWATIQSFGLPSNPLGYHPILWAKICAAPSSFAIRGWFGDHLANPMGDPMGRSDEGSLVSTKTTYRVKPWDLMSHKKKTKVDIARV